MTISYTLQPVPFWYFPQLDGKPAAGGKLFTKSSLNPTQDKPAFQDPAGMIPWTNPIVFDADGLAPGPIYWEIDTTSGDLYYLVFTDSTESEVIWEIPIYPISSGGGSGPITITEKVENLIVNSSFLDNLVTTTTQPVANSTVVCPGAHNGLFYPDIQYIQSGSSNAQDTISFVRFTTDPGIGINPISPDFLTPYYMRYQCLNAPSGETYKGIQLPISQYVNTLSGKTLTFTFYARATVGTPVLQFFIYQYYGSGSPASVSAPVDLVNPITLTNTFAFYTVNFTVPTTLGHTIGNSQDDGTYIQIRFPTNAVETIDIFKPMIFVGNNYPVTIYESVEEIEPELQTPRTGDVRISMNLFSMNTNKQKQDGWIPLNNGRIGNSSSNATTRAYDDTWLLYKLIWESTTPAIGSQIGNCRVFNSAGVLVNKGSTALADWNANNQLELPNTLGRVIADAGTGTSPLASFVGTATETLGINQIPVHAHGMPPGSTGFMGRSNTGPYHTVGSGGQAMDAYSNTANAGGGLAHNNMQPTVYYNMIIKL